MPVIGNLFVGLAFKAGRKDPKEWKQTRLDIDRKLTEAIKQWRKKVPFVLERYLFAL